MPTKVNSAGEMQEYIPRGNEGAGQFTGENGIGGVIKETVSRVFSAFRQDNAKRKRNAVDGKGEVGYNDSVGGGSSGGAGDGGDEPPKKSNNSNSFFKKPRSRKSKLNEQELAMYYDIIGQKRRGDHQYETSKGGRIIVIETEYSNKLVFDNGKYEEPMIFDVYVFKSSDELDNMLHYYEFIGVIK